MCGGGSRTWRETRNRVARRLGSGGRWALLLDPCGPWGFLDLSRLAERPKAELIDVVGTAHLASSSLICGRPWVRRRPLNRKKRPATTYIGQRPQSVPTTGRSLPAFISSRRANSATCTSVYSGWSKAPSRRARRTTSRTVATAVDDCRTVTMHSSRFGVTAVGGGDSVGAGGAAVCVGAGEWPWV